MKQLIISNYDSECDFTWIVLDNGNEIERGRNAKELIKYDLYDEEWHWFDLCEELQEDRFYPTDIFYGAIWTSKGLIYVAKMNEKGDLELL